jgi:hypothetical protein
MTRGRRRAPTARVRPALNGWIGKRVTELVRTACQLRAVNAAEGPLATVVATELP